MGSPGFILSCREADWLGAADRVKIEDDYGEDPVVLRLQPFSCDDAREFLSQEFPKVDAEQLLDHLGDRGIEGLYRNPLTLWLLGEVAQEEGSLPERRADLFDRACRVMLKEKNRRHDRDSHARRHEEGLLLASGALCATQLLCDCAGIYDGPYAKTPAGSLNIIDIEGLPFPFGGAAGDALRTRLFQAEGEKPVSRTSIA